MKNIFLILFACSVAVNISNGDKKGDQNGSHNIEQCLKAWGNHPFGEGKKFRTLGTTVKVLGIGGATKDETSTETPELILIKPTVAVMSKQKYQLMNPNGWYCLTGPVAVLGKVEIEIQCKAHLAHSNESVSVAASNESGVAVLGSIKVNRVGCP